AGRREARPSPLGELLQLRERRADLVLGRRLHDRPGETCRAAQLDVERERHGRSVAGALEVEGRPRLCRPALGRERETPRGIVLEDEELQRLAPPTDAADLGARLDVDRFERRLPLGRTVEIPNQRVDVLLRLRDLDRVLDLHSSISRPTPRSAAARMTSAAAPASITPTPTDL